MLEGFIENIARVKVGDNEDVSAAGHRGFGEFFLGDGGVDGGVELHFPVEEDF